MKKCLILCLLFLQLNARAIDFSNDFEEISKAVVFIANEVDYFEKSNFRDYESLRYYYEWIFPRGAFHGTGFFISPDGYIVTNNHVIDGATTTRVIVRDQGVKVYEAKVVGTHPLSDLAVLKIEDENEFPYFNFGDSDEMHIGEMVIAIGNPLTSHLESTVTMGILSGKNRSLFGHSDVEDYLQIDAAINGGNSGGPLLNSLSEVIGVVCSTMHFCEGLSFAIASHTVQSIVHQIILNGEFCQGYLGAVVGEDLEILFDRYSFDRREGARIEEIEKDSPAEKAGLQVGDRIITFNGRKIWTPQSFEYQCMISPAYSTIHLTVDRNGEIFEISVELEEFNP